MNRRKGLFLLLGLGVALALAAGLLIWRPLRTAARTQRVISFIRNPADKAGWILPAGARCGDAPFQLPTAGYIGFVWDDAFRPLHRHTGLDIFAGTQPGDTPVYAATDGYLTRLPEWKSTLIQRIPSDPLQPDRQIWIYYTHLADPDGASLIDAAFPPGTQDMFIPAGTLLGRQGNFSGTPGSPVGVHLHISIVLDDGQGGFRNESRIENTLDPSPYFGFPLNANAPVEDIPGADACQ